VSAETREIDRFLRKTDAAFEEMKNAVSVEEVRDAWEDFLVNFQR
jgi:hypothetical protein